MNIDDLPLMSKPELAARLAAHCRPGQRKFVPEMTIKDVSRWCSVSYSALDQAARGRAPVSARLQVRLTQFYSMLDSGALRLVVDGKHKNFIRVEPGKAPPPAVRHDPRVEFTLSGPVLKW